MLHGSTIRHRTPKAAKASKTPLRPSAAARRKGKKKSLRRQNRQDQRRPGGAAKAQHRHQQRIAQVHPCHPQQRGGAICCLTPYGGVLPQIGGQLRPGCLRHAPGRQLPQQNTSPSSASRHRPVCRPGHL